VKSYFDLRCFVATFLLFTALIGSAKSEEAVSFTFSNIDDFNASTEAPTGMLTINSEDDSEFIYYNANLIYAEYESFSAHLRLIIPNSSKGKTGQAEFSHRQKMPLIMFVQGSAWLAQNLDERIPMLMAIAQETGMAIASVQYRPSTVAKSPAQLMDVKSAIRYMRANAAKYNIDPNRIGIWGDSSGGHLSSLVGVTANNEDFLTKDNLGFSDHVNAVANFYGPTDFVEMTKYPSIVDHSNSRSPEFLVIGGSPLAGENAAKVSAYNPITYVDKSKKTPPFLIMHGDADLFVPFNQSVILYNALKATKNQVTFYKVKGAGHGQRFYTPKVINLVKKFFNGHL